MLAGWERGTPLLSSDQSSAAEAAPSWASSPLQPNPDGIAKFLVGGGGKKRWERDPSVQLCRESTASTRKQQEPHCPLPTPRESDGKDKAAPFFWGGRRGGDPLAAQRTISDSKEGEEASLRGGFSILLLSGDELSLLQGQIHLLLRVVVVELADVGDEGPGMGGGGGWSDGGGCRASAAGQHAPHCPPQHSSRAP